MTDAPDNTTVTEEVVYVQEETIPGRVICKSRANPGKWGFFFYFFFVILCVVLYFFFWCQLYKFIFKVLKLKGLNFKGKVK